jgi:streptogrisin C
MNRKSAARILASVTMAAGTAVAFTLPATAAPAEVSVVPTTEADPVVQAMQRDLGLTKAQAEQRLQDEAEARKVHETVTAQLGEEFAGAYYDAERATLVVGVTDAAEFSAVKAAGATPKLVEHTVAELESAAAKLDAKESRAPESVTGWYVDLEANSIVVTTAPGTAKQAERFVAKAGVDADAVDVVESKETPQTFMDVVGGNAYYIGSGARCSVGFAVTGGFVTAGHCGTTGSSTTSPSGRFAGSSFPGNDYAYVQVNSGNTLRPWVNMYNGSARVVSGSSVAPVGSSVCRSGSTTGWHCGTIEAMNQTVRYAEGSVSGLTRTNVCAEPGDSGGSFISGNQAQGMTSGGSGNCTYGGTTYFQPVNEALSAYGVSLITG